MLYDYMFLRKSVRKYKDEALSQETVNEMLNFAKNAMPLLPDIAVEFIMTDDVNNLIPVRAPHYMLICSEVKEGYLNNVGFIIEQLDLYLSKNGLGSCWLGMAKPKTELPNNLEYVIALGFGAAAESPHRSLQEFNRKPLEQISSGSHYCLDAVRLAPSATNSQNWFFACDEGKIHLYLKTLGPLKHKLYFKMNEIDAGIALAFIYVAKTHKGDQFNYQHIDNAPEINDYHYIGSVV